MSVKQLPWCWWGTGLAGSWACLTIQSGDGRVSTECFRQDPCFFAKWRAVSTSLPKFCRMPLTVQRPKSHLGPQRIQKAGASAWYKILFKVLHCVYSFGSVETLLFLLGDFLMPWWHQLQPSKTMTECNPSAKQCCKKNGCSRSYGCALPSDATLEETKREKWNVCAARRYSRRFCTQE